MSKRTDDYYASHRPSEYSDEELLRILAHCGPKEARQVIPEAGTSNPDVGPRCPACRMGLVTHEPSDPHCVSHRPNP